MPLSLFLLGPPRVEIDGEAIAFPRQKSLALLVYLAVTGEQQRRDTLAALLWPESADARGALRRELSSLRAALGDGDWLNADRESVALNGDVWLDVDDFLAAARSDAPAEWQQAADLYREDFLTGFSLADAPDFDDWRFFASEEYRRTFAAALERLVAHHQSAGDPDGAIPYARRLLALDNLHEPSHRILMRLYALAGQHAAALRQYDECVRLLDEELGVPPEEETTELHEAIRTRRGEWQGAGGRGQGAGEKSQVVRDESPNLPISVPQSPVPDHNLPPQSTPFVGRRREVEEVRSLLAEPVNRLVTITGVGGIGKSRLGLAVAETLRDAFADGVWFVPLAALDSAEAVPRAIAAALSVPTGDGNGRALLLHFLRDKRLLLLLDNFEHLLEGADFLAELLHGAPKVKLLVTSQERLNLMEESLYPLQGLTVGALLAAPGDVAGAASSAPTDDAVHLFVERAQRVQPNFDAAAQGEAIGSICRLVEGMPLAIELAAGWVRVMSCAEIAAEIQRSADFLASDTRNLPARHRSLRAVFERSWALLSTEQQSVLQRLSVFRGGFDRPAALAVADATPHVLMALLDHSFIRRQAGGRFDMHGLLQRFANEKLANESGAVDKSRQAHTDYYAELLNSMPWEYSRPEEVVGIWATRDDAHAYIALDFPNIQIAWRWAVQCEDVDSIRKMMNALVDCLQLTDLIGVGSEILDSSIAAFENIGRLSEKTRAELLGQLLLKRALLMRHDELEARLQLLVRSLSLLRQNPGANPIAIAQAIQRRGATLSDLGQKAAAEKDLYEALALFRAANHPTAVSYMLLNFGHLQWGWGELKAATTSLREAAERFKGTDEEVRHQAFQALAAVNLLQGNYAEAGRLLDRCAIYYRRLPHTHLWSMYIIQNYGELATATGRFADAERYFSEALEQFERIGKAWQNQLVGYLTPGVLLRLQGKLAESENYLENALLTARQVGWQQMEPFVLHHLSRVQVEKGEFHAGLQLAEEALSTSRSISQRFSASAALCQKGHCHIALKQPDAARAAYAQAIDIADTEGIDRLICDALIGIVQLLLWRGDSQLALSLLNFAHTFEASEWETKHRAERMLKDLPQDGTVPRIPSLEEAIRLARAVLGDTVTSPPHPATPSTGHLPTPATSFIGRESELSELAALLSRADVRLATVVAPGGMGKTRLAIEAARRLARDFPDGVWFASLVGVNESSQMLAALVQLLGAPMGAGDAADALLRFFARRRLLLVLDNFEQLAESAPVLAELLAGGPGVKLLVTSRARLNLREEWVFPLAGLTVGALLAAPVAGVTGATSSAPTEEAIRLFVERARQVQPDFDASAEAEAIAAICRTVEGMPLAIELAASWLRAMNCAEIAAEIRRDVDFLHTSLRNVPEQHRSMRAVFERSWGLLTDEEQRGLARLSVFQGGFTRAAAEAVAEVRLPLLSALVDHSLLRHSASGRYDIHELLRQFAAEQLGESGEAEKIHDKHADYFLRLLCERRDDLEWRRLQEALRELIPERENLFAGWRWACERALFRQIRLSAKVLPLYCNLTSAQENGLQLFDQAIGAAEAKAGPEDDLPGLLGILRWRQQCYLQPSHNQPDAYLERLLVTRALLLESKEDVQNELARMSGAIGTQLATVGKGDEGAQWMENAIRHFTERRAFVDLGKVYCRFALLRLGEGKLFQSDELFGRAAEAWRQAKLPAYPLIFRSSVYQQQGRFDEARRIAEQARDMGDDPFTRDFSGMSVENSCYDALSQACVALGALDEALLHFERIREMSEAEGRPWDIALSSVYTPGTILRLQGKMQRARREIENDVAIVRSVGFQQRVAARLEELARLEYDEGNYAASETALNEALEIAEAIDSRIARALTLCLMGHTAAAQDKPEAAGYFRRAIDIALEQGMNQVVLDAVRGVSDLAAASGDVTQAVEWLALVADHPNAEWETKQKAQKALAQLEESLSAEEFRAAQERERGAGLNAAIPAMLEWLAAF